MGKLKHCWFVVAMFCWSSASAIDWNVEPSISLAETYSDNVELQPKGQETTELVTEFLPSIAIDATGKRFDIDFEYRLQSLRYSDRDEFDETLNYGKTQGDVKLISDSVFVNFSGAVNQQNVDPGGRNSISAITRSDRTKVTQYSINPYWQTDFGSGGNIYVGYQFGKVAYENLAENDNETKGINALISGSPARTPWSWKIEASQATIEYVTGSTVDLQRVGGELAWSFSGDAAIFAGGGDENNEFSAQIPGLPKIDGAYWNIGLRGRLDRLTRYSIAIGEKHYGNSYDFSLKREAGRLTTDISYFEETTTVGEQQQNYRALFDFLTDITGAELPSADPEVYVRKTFSGVAALKLPRSTLRFNAYDEKRDYLTSLVPRSDGNTGAAVSWTWTALERTEFSLEAGWIRFDLLGDDNTPEDVRLQFRLKRELKYGMSVSFRAWRNSRSGTTTQNEYIENAVSLGLGKRF